MVAPNSEAATLVTWETVRAHAHAHQATQTPDACHMNCVHPSTTCLLNSSGMVAQVFTQKDGTPKALTIGYGTELKVDFTASAAKTKSLLGFSIAPRRLQHHSACCTNAHRQKQLVM